jgi:hypothetical protein
MSRHASFPLLDAAHRTHGRVARVISRHASRDVGFDPPFKMVAELVVQFLLDSIAPEERPDTQRQRVQQT